MTANAIWALDLMADPLYPGRRFGILNTQEEGAREVLDPLVDCSVPSARVIRGLEQIAPGRELPHIRCDDSPEVASQVFPPWCEPNAFEIRCVQPWNPNQNPCIERFNPTYREEVFDGCSSEDLDQAREITCRWQRTSNQVRPDEASGLIPPRAVRRALEHPGASTCALTI